MLRLCRDRPCVPYHSPRGLSADLDWWSTMLSCSYQRPIPCPVELTDVGAFSDASSGIGIAIVLGGFWRAWRLVPGWQTLNGERDIQWAEAIGFELLIYALISADDSGAHHRLYGDNKGVVEGWWNCRSRNTAVNHVFRRLHIFLDKSGISSTIHSSYVPSASNPADAPSRGQFPPEHLLLPPVDLPPCLNQFLIDATSPYTPMELRLHREGRYPRAATRLINRSLQDTRAQESFNEEHFREEHSLLNIDWES